MAAPSAETWAHQQAPATSAISADVLPDHVVERYEIALAKVQGLLAALGLSTRWVSRISLSLAWKDGRAGDGVPRRMAPELMVHVEDGRKVAEVTVEARSGRSWCRCRVMPSPIG